MWNALLPARLAKEAGYEPPETFEDLIKISQALQKQTRLVGLRLAGSPIRRIGGDVC